jgi:Tol biopolymer transport system component
MKYLEATLMYLVLVVGTPCLPSIRGYAADTDPAIFVMNVDGTMVRKVVQVDGFKLHDAPRWSRDGKQLAFSCQDGPNKIKRFFTVHVDGSQLRTIGEGVLPDWSPDDKQLAFQIPSASIEQRGTYVQNVDGRGKVFLVEGFSPRWSPDGSQITYCFRDSLLVRDLLSGADRGLVNQPGGEILTGFDWSPDGKRLAYVAKVQKVRELFIIDSAGDTPPKSRLRGALNSTLSWSPDGQRLAIGLNQLVQVINPNDDRDATPIPGQVGANRDPAWSPDGKWIAFVSDRKVPAATALAATEVDWKLAEAGRHEKGSIVYSLAYTPDGRRVIMGGDPVKRRAGLGRDHRPGQELGRGGHSHCHVSRRPAVCHDLAQLNDPGPQD